MNAESKLIAAAKRAARKISHAENIPYQTALDRIARQAGRSTWTSFIAAPVAIDQASAHAAAEPDFTAISPDAHLVGVIDYGIAIGARAVLARPEVAGGHCRLTYCTSRSEEYDHPIDPRGLSMSAMITALASSPVTADGRATIQDGTFAFEFDDLGGTSQLRLSLNDRLPPPAPIHLTNEIEEQQQSRRQQRLQLRSQAVLDASPILIETAPYEALDMLTQLAWQSGQADLVFEPAEMSADVILQTGDIRRTVHMMTLENYRFAIAQIKDRARMDQMEIRVPQHGDWQQEFEGDLRTIHATTEPRAGKTTERVRLGFTPFPMRTYAKPPRYEHPQGGRLLLGEHGLFSREVVRAKESSLIVVSGIKGSAKTSRFVVPAVVDGVGADVIISDMDGTITKRLGDIWDRHEARLRLDPRTSEGHRAPAFNPLHPDMMPSSHMATAEWIAQTLLPGMDSTSDGARSLLVGSIDLIVRAPHLRMLPQVDEQDVATLPMVLDWIRHNAGDLSTPIADMEASEAVHGRIRFERFLMLTEVERSKVVTALLQALAFCETPGMRRILAPEDENRGSTLATTLVLKRTPALIIVGGDPALGQGRLCALAMQAAVHLREDFALRETHLFVDDAMVVGPMPWLRKSLSSEHGMQVGMSAAVVLENPHEIDALAPELAGGKAPGVSHWLIEEVVDPEDRARIADAMQVRRAKIASHRTDGRRIDVSRNDIRLLRR